MCLCKVHVHMCAFELGCLVECKPYLLFPSSLISMSSTVAFALGLCFVLMFLGRSLAVRAHAYLK